jgi:hypothetical protein
MAEREQAANRIESDYLAGGLPVEDYTRLRAKLSEERDALRAQHKRLTAKAHEMRSQADEIDAEEEVLRRLADLRAAVAAHVRDARQSGDIAALRAAVSHVFTHMTIRPDAVEWPVKTGYAPRWALVSDYWIEPVPREDMILPRDCASERLQRVPVNLTGSGVPEYPAAPLTPAPPTPPRRR